MKIMLLATSLGVLAAPLHAQTTQIAATAAASAPAVRHSPRAPKRSRTAKHPIDPSITLLSSATRMATVGPDAAGFMNAVQVYPFSEGAIYRAYAAPGCVTDIALQAGEVLVAVAAGDTSRWVVGDTSSGSGAEKRTHILVKPFSSGLTTNLVITTDRRTYHLRLTATAGTPMTAVSWTYAADQLLALRRTGEQAPAPSTDVTVPSLESLRFNYLISGDIPAWRPLRAFDDGQRTYVEFPANIGVGDAPPLFTVAPGGAAELVNYRVRGRYYIVDLIFDVAELRLGTKKQQIVRISRFRDGDAAQGKKS